VNALIAGHPGWTGAIVRRQRNLFPRADEEATHHRRDRDQKWKMCRSGICKRLEGTGGLLFLLHGQANACGYHVPH
jgi:hypothetical protein